MSIFLSKADLQNLTGLTQAKAISKWLDNNPKILEFHKLIWNGCINHFGLPIVEKQEYKHIQEIINE